jgi:hypothetical protein
MTQYSKNKDVAEFVRQLIKTGWRYQMGGRHGKLTSPMGKSLPVPCSPSDRRAFLNFKRDIRKLENLT